MFSQNSTVSAPILADLGQRDAKRHRPFGSAIEFDSSLNIYARIAQPVKWKCFVSKACAIQIIINLLIRIIIHL